MPGSTKRINLVCWNNGGGLSSHIAILVDALKDGPFELTLNGASLSDAPVERHRIVHRARNAIRSLHLRRQQDFSPFDINLHLEDLSPDYFALARCNFFIPNPEWFRRYQRLFLRGIDKVLCTSHSAVDTFSAMGADAHYIGFTSGDCGDPSQAKRREAGFLHVAGRSWRKGTRALSDLWLRHPEWPPLTIVQNASTYKQLPVRPVAAPNIVHRLERVPDAELKSLQNEIPVHLCPSEVEGFGHVIVEAMSCSAVTLTTDGAPMNELLGDDRGVLVKPARTGRQYHGTTYFVDPDDLERKVAEIIAMDDASREHIGSRARAWYEQNDLRFRRELVQVLGDA